EELRTQTDDKPAHGHTGICWFVVEEILNGFLDEHSLPILAKMVQTPESSLELFYELVEKLDELVQSGELDWQAAASEVDCTLDRPQIYTHEPLEPAIITAYDLSAQYDKAAWNDFVALVKRSNTA
ncbi:hypothetical protein CR970_04415, partial [Candidatus Saccharibacteria bacterium]